MSRSECDVSPNQLPSFASTFQKFSIGFYKMDTWCCSRWHAMLLIVSPSVSSLLLMTSEPLYCSPPSLLLNPHVLNSSPLLCQPKGIDTYTSPWLVTIHTARCLFCPLGPPCGYLVFVLTKHRLNRKLKLSVFVGGCKQRVE